MTPELHRPLNPERIGAGGLEQEVTAVPAELEALARRLLVPAVLALRCTFRLHREPAGAVRAAGVLEALVVRECVVSLDPFEQAVREEFRIRFVPAGTESEDDDPESDDEIPYRGNAIDLGEAACEQLALALDPFPRKPGAVLPDAPGEDAAGPFAALARRTRH